MQAADVSACIEQAIPDAAVDVEGADCTFTVSVISAAFAGLLPVKRQQLVLNLFTDLLASGELHALTVKAQTPQEWEAKQTAGFVQISL